jgi:two-component system response regulator YesN
MKLLILDDDTQIREGIRRGVDWKSLGFEEVRSAGDGLSGLEIAREMAPDIVLSDVRMPGMDGLEFLHRVREIFPGIKVALISGYDDFEYLQKAIRYGADGYELKPVKMRNLFRLIGDLKEKLRRERAPGGGGNPPAAPGGPPSALEEALPCGGVEEAGGKPGPYSPRISRAIDYVRRNLAEDLDTRNLGAYLNIGPNYFSSLFKRETGISFSAFVSRSRLRAAACLLERTDQRIAEIAAHTGFRDSVYFSQVFKKTRGCSPSKYRKNRPAGKEGE